MTPKEIYCMGRAEYLMDFEGYTLSAGYKKAEQEWNEFHPQTENTEE